MEEKIFNSWVESYLSALRENRLLVIIDSSSKGDKAQFRLVAYQPGCIYSFRDFAPFLLELGFKQSKSRENQFICHCAGRWSYFILDRIGELLCKRVEGFNNREYYAMVSVHINVA